jgi:hypothetical protein
MIRPLGWSVSGPIASLLQCSLVVTDNRPHSPEKASVCRQAMVGRCTSQVDRWVLVAQFGAAGVTTAAWGSVHHMHERS